MRQTHTCARARARRHTHTQRRQFINVFYSDNPLLVVVRTLAQKLRCFLFSSKLPQHLWTSFQQHSPWCPRLPCLSSPRGVIHTLSGWSVPSLADCTQAAANPGQESRAGQMGSTVNSSSRTLYETPMMLWIFPVALRIRVEILNKLEACEYLVSTYTSSFTHLLSTPSSAQIHPGHSSCVSKPLWEWHPNYRSVSWILLKTLQPSCSSGHCGEIHETLSRLKKKKKAKVNTTI